MKPSTRHKVGRRLCDGQGFVRTVGSDGELEWDTCDECHRPAPKPECSCGWCLDCQKRVEGSPFLPADAPAEQGQSGTKGDTVARQWRCVCGDYNTPKRTFCGGCMVTRPTTFDTRSARYCAEQGSTNEARQWLVKACDWIER